MIKRVILHSLILIVAAVFVLIPIRAESASSDTFSITVTVPLGGITSEIITPGDKQTCSRTPTITGTTSLPNQTVEIKGESGRIEITVATTTSDSNGNFSVAVNPETPLDLGKNTLTPYVNGNPGTGKSPIVNARPATSEEPTITSPAEGEKIKGRRPTIKGLGKTGEIATLYTKEPDGTIIQMGQNTVNADGTFSITPSRDFAVGVYQIYLVIGENTSGMLSITFVDPYGIVYDSGTNLPVEGAVVTLQRSLDGGLTWNNAVQGVDIEDTDVNPQTTGSDGAYSYLTVNGKFRLLVSASGYTFPSTVISAGLPHTGSHGELFTVSGAILNIDLPLDFSGSALLKVNKDANKKQVSIGDIITYTVIINNQGASDVTGVYLKDNLAAGLKYLEGKVLLDGNKIPDPTGTRTKTFNIGTIPAGSSKALKYQVVVGSGVTFGNYENKAWCEFASGRQISNSATETVKIIPEPLFDLGTVIGKVYWDLNKNGMQDGPQGDVIEKGLAGARIAMEDGTVVTTDSDGKFHIPMITPGEHIFRLDERSLPSEVYVTTRREQIVSITKGLLAKVNFGINYFDEKRIKEALIEAKTPVNIVQDQEKPKARLNISLFDEPLVVSNACLNKPAEFRIFSNYSLFITKWKLEIFDKALRKLVDSIEGDKNSLFRPIFWDGLDNRGRIIRPNRAYTYKLTVFSEGRKFDTTKEKEFRVILQKEPEEFPLSEDLRKKEEKEREDKEKWLDEESKVNNLDKQNIVLDGEMIKVYSPDAIIEGIKIRKDNKVIEDIPVRHARLTLKELMNSFLGLQAESEVPAADIIMPRGKYNIEINTRGGQEKISAPSPEGGWLTIGRRKETDTAAVKALSYRKDLTIGDDYFFLVGMGNLALRENAHKGNIEPVEQSKEFKDGLYSEGKLAYYLKAKIKGKYLLTSSLDTQRQQKELFKIVDPNKYYPIYGDDSKVNYEAADTQGNFYALLEWDKSHLKYGNYETGLIDTELSFYSRTLYGGKVFYESVSTTQFGEPDTKVILFGTAAKQMAAHNEFIGTGGSLYYLKHEYIIEGSEKIEIQVRDKINGMVLVSLAQNRGSDYEINYDEGRIIFWKPISYIADTTTLISSQISGGNKVYVVADYEYETKDKYDEGSRGARVSQQVGDYLRVGGTYVKEEKNKENFELKGYDTTLRLGKNTKIEAEYALTQSEEINNFISTDGGISFATMGSNDFNKGKATSIKAETSLLNRVNLGTYYQKVEKGFSTANTVANQGTEKKGVRSAIQLTPNIELNLWHDIQKLIEDANEQVQTQIGARETQTTTAQLAYRREKFDLISEYRRQRVRGKVEGVDSEVNPEMDSVATKFDYRLSKRLALFLKEELNLQGEDDQKTTLGATFSPIDNVFLSGSQSIGRQGTATELGARVNVTDKVNLSGNIQQSGASRISSLTGEAKVDKKSTVYGTLSQDDSLGAGGKKQSIILGTKKTLDKGVEVRSERSFIKSDKENTSGVTYAVTKDYEGRKMAGSFTNQRAANHSSVSQSNIMGLSAELNEKLAIEGSLEKARVNNLDKTKTDRYALALAASYLEKDKFKASAKLEGRLDQGQEDTRQMLAYLAADGKVARDLSLFNKTHISQTQNLTANTVTAGYREILTGFAYRPLYFDQWNIIGKYTFLEDENPGNQEDYQDIDKTRSHIYGLEGIHDLNKADQVVFKTALKQQEEKVAGFDDYTKSQTWLGISRLNHKFFKDYEVGLEYRILRQVQADDYKQGVLLELNRYLGNWLKIGIGYNFTGFSDDLAHDNYSNYGWFVKATSSLGEIAYELMRTQEEKVREFKIESEKCFTQIMQLPKEAARVQEAIFYRDQAKHWIAIGEYEEAYNCLKRGIKRIDEMRLDLFKVEVERLSFLNKKKIAQLVILDDKVKNFKKDKLAQIQKIKDWREKDYQLLKLFYGTGKIYFMNGQYRKAIKEWELGMDLVMSRY